MNVIRWWTAGLIMLGSWVALPLVTSAQDAEQPAQGAEVLPTLDDELDQFWSERRGVRVLQRRLFTKESRLQLTLSFSIIPNDPAVTYFPIGLRAAYWLSEPLGIELSGAYNGTALTSDTEIGEIFSDAGFDFFPRDQRRWNVNAAVLWSPMYGKFSLLGRKIAHFDWTLAAGFGVLGVETPPEENLGTPESKLLPEVILGTGWAFWLAQDWAVRLDYRQGIFQKSTGGVALPSEISLGFSYFFL